MSALGAALLLFGLFFLLLFASVPISIAIGVSSFVTIVAVLGWSDATFILGQQMTGGVESFPLLAIPLFILAGNIMNSGGIARRLIDLALVIVGRVPGSLAHTNVVANMLFGALSGSAVASAAAIGGTLHRRQEEEGYDPAFSTAVNISSASTGLLIPPTTAAIVYSTIAGGVSVSALFMAGYVPGILMGLVVIAVATVIALRQGLRGGEGVGIRQGLIVLLRAIPSLLLIIIVVGGIVAGVFTATEGAAVAVVYCLVLSMIYRALNREAITRIIRDTVSATGVVMLLVAASSAMSWIMAFSGIPGAITDAMLSVASSGPVVIALMLIVLLAVGTFLDITPAILIFTPIMLPIAESVGMDPVHFGMVLIMAMCIGTMTPPVGSVLFVATGITGVSIERVVPRLLPFFTALIALLILIAYVPALSLWLPGLTGSLE